MSKVYKTLHCVLPYTTYTILMNFRGFKPESFKM